MSPLAINGRVEAKIVVPAGGAAVSASTGAHSTAVTVTVPAASHYMTAAGGVTSLLTSLQTQLNENVQGYPQSATAMQAAVGYGTWTSGWLLNIASGNDAGAFGGVTMTAVSTPTYSSLGPRVGIDKAVGFDSNLDAFSGGNTYNSTATDDIVWAGVVYFDTVVGNSDVMGKGADQAHTLPGYAINMDSGALYWVLQDGVDFPFGQVAVTAGTWNCVVAVADRTRNVGRIGIYNLAQNTTAVSAEFSITAVGSMSNALNFCIGASGYGPSGSRAKVAAHYIGTGPNVATGLSANLATAVVNFANAVNSRFDVTLSTTTGLAAFANTFWPSSISFTSTALRDVLGFAYDFDYPQTAAQMSAVIGGDWTSGAGYLLNESSGNPAAAFGAPASLTATSLTYSNAGARGGSDKSIGFNAGADNASAGDVYDVTSTDDIVLLWVGYLSAAPGGTRALITKFSAATIGYYVQVNSSAQVLFGAYHTGAALLFETTPVAMPTAEWHVGMAVIDRSTGKARVGTIGLRSGAVTVSTETTAAALSCANAGNLKLGQRDDGGADACQEATLSAFYVTAGASVASGSSANLSSALSLFATYMKSQTGTKQARGLWFPDCPVSALGLPRTAPTVSDLRQTMSPTGQMCGLVGNNFRRHLRVTWSHVPLDRAWESQVTYANASWEWFYKETQIGLGSIWFPTTSPLQIYDHAGVLVGADDNSGAGTAGWTIVGRRSVEPERSEKDYAGLWRIELPTLIAAGS